jgi:ABC-type dipeptide/oligopeptide/nickel transport system ATPase subunit
MPDFKPEDFVQAVRKVVQTLRYGPRELTLTTLGLLLLALPKVLPKVPESLKPVLDWIPWLGVFLLALAAWLIWRKVAAPVPEGKPKPPAIKGPAPFGPYDAELFARLGRNEDLDRLRDWILDDQKPLVALMGESGVGKTSLLRAGLESHLKGDEFQVIYWEALPTEPENGLLHAVQSRWGDPTTAPARFADLASAVARAKRVVVIDQAEQLSPDRHRTVFAMLRRIATASPPYAATWVVTFRREYLPVWRDFELGLPEPAQRRMETLSLRRFLPEQAERVIAVLAEEGGLPIEQKVVTALVESIEFEGGVTPADIGISLLVLSEILGDGKDSAFTVKDFRERGGQAGLLERYLERLLMDFPEAERREIFQALLSLIDLDNDQRRAEGRTPLELEEAARPTNSTRFEAVLRFLTSGKARILEEVPEPPLRYRLIHERLIPAIRRLTGVLLAEAEQAGRLLERAYRIWSRDRKARYLLSGRELRQVLRFRDQLPWGDEADQKREYLRLGRQYRNRRWGSAAIVLMSLGLGIYLYSEHRSQEAADRALLTSWKLPPNLLDHLHHIEALTLPKGVTRLAWLKKSRRLRFLEITDATLESLEEGLPEGLHALKVEFSQEPPVSELPGLPEKLASLDIMGDINLKNFKKFPHNLRTLRILSDPALLGSAHLPHSLESLNVVAPQEIEDLGEIDISYLKNLKTFSIFKASPLGMTTSKFIFPSQLRSLKLGFGITYDDRGALPANLESLRCTCSPEPKSLPGSLKHLRLDFPDEIKIPSPPLYSLYTIDSKVASFPLQGLVDLRISVFSNNFFARFPSTLKRLEISGLARKKPIMIEDLPQGLRELILSDGVKAIFREGLPKGLKNLEFGIDQVSSPEFPPGLTSLVYSGSLRAPLPSSLRSLTIRIKDQDLPFLDSLWALDQLRLHGEVTKIPSHLGSLKDLDISDTKISTLQGLPPNLTSLTLRPGQVVSLDGLPESVVSLQFREP